MHIEYKLIPDWGTNRVKCSSTEAFTSWQLISGMSKWSDLPINRYDTKDCTDVSEVTAASIIRSMSKPRPRNWFEIWEPAGQGRTSKTSAKFYQTTYNAEKLCPHSPPREPENSRHCIQFGGKVRLTVRKKQMYKSLRGTKPKYRTQDWILYFTQLKTF
jgi:hypothetical protein